MSYLLGIDLGTSSVKTALFAADNLRLISQASAAYPLSYPRPGWAEQTPQDWWQAVVTTLRQVTGGVDPGAVEAIGLDGQMHGQAAVTMLWLGRHRPDHAARSAQVLGVKDWVRLRLTGEAAADHSDASATWLYNLNQGARSPDLFDFIGWRPLL